MDLCCQRKRQRQTQGDRDRETENEILVASTDPPAGNFGRKAFEDVHNDACLFTKCHLSMSEMRA